MRLACGACIAVAAAVLATAIYGSPALAVTRVHIGGTDPVSGVADFDVSGGDSRNHIRLWADDSGRYLFVRDNQFVSAPRCRRLKPTLVRCPVSQAWLFVWAGAGRDQVSLRGGVPESMEPLVYGGQRRDVLIGGPEDDELTGGPGNDVVVGGKGDDRLIGQSDVFGNGRSPGDDTLRGGPGDDHLGEKFESGSDRFFGGPGNDDINAGNPERDRRLDGGKGRDRCVFKRIDPPPTRCEVEERLRPG